MGILRFPRRDFALQHLRERISFIQGLAEGINLGANSREGRLLGEMISVLGDMADSIAEVKMAQNQLEQIVESMDDDLVQLEEDVYDEDDDEDLVEVECPSCQEMVCFDAELLDEEGILEVTCPTCDEVVFTHDGEGLDGTKDEEDLDCCIDTEPVHQRGERTY